MDEKNFFDVARARQWKLDVETELTEVDRLLTEVYTCIQTMPDQEDPILGAIFKVGEDVQGAWTQLNSTLKETMRYTDEIIKHQNEGIEEALAFVKTLIERIK